MNSDNVTERLNAVRELLHQLGEGVVELANTHPDVFDDPQLKKEVEEFQEAYQEAKRRLDNPKLSIATLGTTSSGKSTIVNALIGRRIAPIERSEMSGGILKFGDSDTVELLIENTENAKWETGKWTDLTDDELYHRIQQVMWSYHETRKQRTDCLAPQITVQSQLLPVRDRALLNLPEGIDLEIIDLPGLKSVQDRPNLDEIQTQVNKCCSLVALDYGQVDEEHRECLLKELKEVVKSLNGRTDSMFFVLNRVDMRGADDFPLEQQIERLKAEIQSVLSLDTPPDVIPFSARLLYYAQCAWGVEGGHLASKIDQQKRLKLLQAMFADCAGMIRQSTAGDKNLRRWFRDIEDDVEDGKSIDDETMRTILRYAHEWSGGQKFWDTLRYRVQESFSELVIAPTLNPVLTKFDALIEQIALQINNSINYKKEEIQQKSENIKQQRQELNKETKKIKQNVKRGVDSIIEDLEKNTPEARDKAIKKAKRRGVDCKNLTRAVDNIKDDLSLKLIIPIEEAFEQQKPAFELLDMLKDSIPFVYAERIARAYEIIKEVSRTFEYDTNLKYFYKSVRINDEEAMTRLYQAEQAYRQLYLVMRDAISQRAEFSLQVECDAINQSLQSFIDQQRQLTLDQVTEVFPDLREAIQAEFIDILQSHLPQLSENIFDISENKIEESITTKKEKVGTKTVSETYTRKRFFFFKVKDTRYVQKDVYQDFEYRELQVPDFNTISDQWGQEIQEVEAKFWNIIATWIKDNLETISKEFQKGIDDITELTERTLKRRLKQNDQEFQEFKQFWLEIESEKNILLKYRENLQAQINQ